MVQSSNGYVFECTYHERHIPKAAGFRWDPDRRQWWTDKPVVANKLVDYATPETKEGIEQGVKEHEDTLTLSRAASLDSDIDIPAPDGLEYLPFQRAGIAYASTRQNVLFADEQGLGKTIQAIGTINLDDSIRTVLVIVPATLRINWQREMEKWFVNPRTIGIATSKEFPDTDVAIINYDILKNHRKALHSREWDCLICDESHYLKNAKAQRTKEVVGGRGIKPISARRILFLTGTPILNKPIELWTTLKRLDPSTWRSWKYFTDRYCDAHHNGFGWDTSGASNLNELQEILRSTIMVRRLKSEVMKELPPIRRQVIALPANGALTAIQNEWKAMHEYKESLAKLRAAVEIAKVSDDPEDYANAVEELQSGAKVAFEQMSKARYETAMAKLPIAIQHIKDMLENESKIVIFAHHLDVLNTLYEEFKDEAVILTGQTKLDGRQSAVDRFQNDDKIKLFIGSIQAAGVGITLTAASTEIFVELDWVPANISQAESRCHRIGQLGSVLVQHLVLDGSLDAHMVQTLIAKQDVLDEALDAPIEEREPFILPTLPIEEPSTARVTKREIYEEAETITPEPIEAVREGLMMLAMLDPDRASEINQEGFNAVDAKIGHDLAWQARLTPKQAILGRKILRKYRRQLGNELMERMGSTGGD